MSGYETGLRIKGCTGSGLKFHWEHGGEGLRVQLCIAKPTCPAQNSQPQLPALSLD